jgi:hypothetical protein
MNPPPHHPGPVPVKKGLPPLAWAGIGCGGLVLLAVIAGGMMVGTCAKKGIQFASELAANPGREAAEKVVMEHPGIERVSEDPKAGTMEIRLKESGETVTLGYAELGQGRIPFKDASGDLLPDVPGDLAKIPAWVPRYPGTKDERLVFHEEVPQRVAGMVTSQTTDSSETVSRFFEDEAAKLSLDASGSSSMNINGNSSLKLTFREGKRELVVIGFGKSGEPLTIQTTYKETK